MQLYISSKKEEREKLCIPKGKEPVITLFSSSLIQCTLPLQPTIANPQPPQTEPQNIVQPIVDVLDPTVTDSDPKPLQIKPQDNVQQTVDVLEPAEEPLSPVSTVAYGLDSDPEELSESKQTILYKQPELPSQSRDQNEQ